MQFQIRCETYVRLSRVLRYFKQDETRACFRSVYVERKAGKLIALSTNAIILAAEFLAEQPSEPDAYMYMTIDPALVQQCETESALGGVLHVVNLPGIGASARTTFGYQYPGNVAMTFADNVTHEKWRGIVDTRETAGPMLARAEAIADLAAASPSGVLVFPDVIDGSKPVVVRDKDDPNWFGMFMPTVFEDGKRIKRPAATYPEWAL